MKKTFLRILPVVAAILLATSCSKDDDNGNVVNNIEEQPSTAEPVLQPTAAVVENGYVSIPFSVGIASGEGLSKITCTTEEVEGKKVVHRSFDDGDLGKQLTVTGDDIEESKLTLGKDEDGNFKFSGNVSVKAEKVSDFKDGSVKMKGVFGAALTEPKVSNVSLDDAMTRYAYEVCEEFSSGDDDIELVDQNAYLHFTLASTQKKLRLDIAGSTFEYGDKVVGEVDQEPFKDGDGYKELWVAVPGGSNIKGNLVSAEGKTATRGLIINIDRHDVVDLGLSVLWCTSNATSSETDQKIWEKATALADDVEGYDLPSADNFRELTGENPVSEVTVTKEWNPGSGAEAGYTFTTAYGSVFFPAAGYYGGTDAGSVGYYWSGTEDVEHDDNAWLLFFYDGGAHVVWRNVGNGYSVRLVRGL